MALARSAVRPNTHFSFVQGKAGVRGTGSNECNLFQLTDSVELSLAIVCERPLRRSVPLTDLELFLYLFLNQRPKSFRETVCYVSKERAATFSSKNANPPRLRCASPTWRTVIQYRKRRSVDPHADDPEHP